MDQTAYIRLVTSNKKWEGLCAPITTVWLIGRSQGLSMPKIKDLLRDRADEVERIASIYYGHKEMQIDSYLRHYLKTAGLSKTDCFQSRVGLLKMMFDKIRRLDNRNDSFGYVTVSNQALNPYNSSLSPGASHAMGVDLLNAAFFDPNGGHADFWGRKNLVDFFQDYLKRVYPDFGGASYIQFYN